MDAQEVYDTTIQAMRIAEHPDVSLPVMICFDGFQVSHDMEWVEMLDDDEVKKFIGEFQPADQHAGHGQPHQHRRAGAASVLLRAQAVA